jgi:hypothetical protein
MSSIWLGLGAAGGAGGNYMLDPLRHGHDQSLTATADVTHNSLTLTATPTDANHAAKLSQVTAVSNRVTDLEIEFGVEGAVTDITERVGALETRLDPDTGTPLFAAVSVSTVTDPAHATRKDYVDAIETALDSRLDAVETESAGNATTLASSVNQAVKTTSDVTFASVSATSLACTTLSASVLNVPTINSLYANDLQISDLTVTVAAENLSGDKSASDGAGVVVRAGTSGTRSILYNAANDRFETNAPGGLRVDALYLTDTLPAQTNYGLYISGTDGVSPVCGRIYCGDGSGWSMRVASRTSSTNTDLFTFSDNGRLGIGTTSPQALLHLQTASGNAGFVLRGGASSTGFQFYQEGNGAAQCRHFQPGQPLVFATTDSGGSTVECARFHAAVSGTAPAMSVGSTQRAATLTVGMSSGLAPFTVRNTSNSTIFTVNSSENVSVTNNISCGSLDSAGAMTATRLTLAGNGSTGDLSLVLTNSSHASSNRAGIGIGSRWQFACDSGGNGTDDLFVYDATRGELLARWFDGVLNLDNGLYVNTSKEGSVGTFRVSGDTDDNLIYGASASDRAAMGTNSPAAKFHVMNTSSSQDIMHISRSGSEHCWSFQDNGTLYGRVGSAAGRFKMSFGGSSGEYGDFACNGYLRVWAASSDLSTGSSLFEAPADSSEPVRVRNSGGLNVTNAISGGSLSISGNATISGNLTVSGTISPSASMLSSAIDASIQWIAHPTSTSNVYRVVISGQASFAASETQTITFPSSWQAASDMTAKNLLYSRLSRKLYGAQVQE